MRVLVAYGSTRGGTAGLAHMVADALARHQISTDVRPAGDVRAPDDVDAVIVGGALYNSRWHPDAVAFVGRHRNELKALPVWFFSSGPLDDSARSGAVAALPQVSGLAREIDIRGHMTFGGLLDKKPTGLLGMFGWGPEGDFRDRHHVAEWVERIAADLRGELTPTVRVLASDPAPLTVSAPPEVHKEPEPAPPAAKDDVEPEPEPVPAPEAPKGSRLRRYLRLEDDSDQDEGLDLFDETDDPLVGDSAGN